MPGPITPLPPVPNVVKVVLQGNTSEATPIPWENVLHYTYSAGPPSTSDLSSLAHVVSGTWNDDVASLCPSTTKLEAVTVTDLSADDAAQASWIEEHVGTRGDDEIPANVAMLVTYPVNVRYRGGHPRSYLLVGGNADFLDAAHWSAAFTAEVQSHWRNFLDAAIAFSEGEWTIRSLCSVFYYGHGGPYIVGANNPKLRVTPIVILLDDEAARTEQQMASQRRRIGRKRR